MPSKRVQFDDQTWEAIRALISDSGSTFQDIAEEAFAVCSRSVSNRSG